jgi:hypothetical protein
MAPSIARKRTPPTRGDPGGDGGGRVAASLHRLLDRSVMAALRAQGTRARQGGRRDLLPRMNGKLATRPRRTRPPWAVTRLRSAESTPPLLEGRRPTGCEDVGRVRRCVVRRRDRRPNRALDRRMAAGSARSPHQHVRAATRSVNWSSTCRQCAARLDPTRGLGRTAPDQGPAARERGRSQRGLGSRPHRSHRGWSLHSIGGSRSETAGTVLPISSRPGLRRRCHALVRAGLGSARTR